MDYLFKPTINFRDDNLSMLYAWAYQQVATSTELIEFTFDVLEDLGDYEEIEVTNHFDMKLVKSKIDILKEIGYPLYSYITNRSFQTKQFESI